MHDCGGSAAQILGAPHIKHLEEEAKRLLGCDPAHGWPHVLRVASWARRIIVNEGLLPDLRVLYIAVVLHDVGRALGGGHHAVASADYATTTLPRFGLSSVVGQVRHAILAHSYSLGLQAVTSEAKILSDADKLDALGAIGIARVFHTGCQKERSFNDSLRHFREKILRLPALMHYKYSRKEAERLAGRIQEFLRWWASEIPG